MMLPKYLHRSPVKLYRYAMSGKLPGTKEGGVSIPTADVLAFLEQRSAETEKRLEIRS